MQMEEPPLVQSAAAIMRSFCYTHRDELSAGFIVAGWDRKKGPQVCYVIFHFIHLLCSSIMKYKYNETYSFFQRCSRCLLEA